MIFNFKILGRLPSLNDYTKANRGNIYAGATMKKNAEMQIISAIYEYLPNVRIKAPVRLNFRWVEPKNNRDLDNICFAKKFILDALVKSEVLQGDSQKYVKGFTDTFDLDRENPRIEVEIIEVENA